MTKHCLYLNASIRAREQNLRQCEHDVRAREHSPLLCEHRMQSHVDFRCLSAHTLVLARIRCSCSHIILIWRKSTGALAVIMWASYAFTCWLLNKKGYGYSACILMNSLYFYTSSALTKCSHFVLAFSYCLLTYSPTLNTQCSRADIWCSHACLKSSVAHTKCSNAHV